MPDINDQQSMKNFTLGIIQTLHDEKAKRRMKPDHVTRNEVLQFIKNRVEKSLKTLENEQVLTSGETMGYDNKYYELTENKNTNGQ